MTELTEQIRAYRPWNEQEQRDKETILACLKSRPEVFTRRDTTAHMTASAWIVNKSRDKVLMIYHNIYGSWAWTGGHADGERDLLSVALREAREETGLRDPRPVTGEIFSLEILTVDGHEKRGEYVSSHLHLNLTYLLEADEAEPLRICQGENSGVKWFPLKEALSASTEPWFVQRIYSKLNAKLTGLSMPEQEKE